MTGNILRNLIGPRATRQHPQVVRPPFENSRGEITNDMAECIFCGTCAAKCPSQCVQVDKKGATWSYNPYACVSCGVCAAACPTGSLRQRPNHLPPTVEMVPVLLHGSIRKRGADPVDQ